MMDMLDHTMTLDDLIVRLLKIQAANNGDRVINVLCGHAWKDNIGAFTVPCINIDYNYDGILVIHPDYKAAVHISSGQAGSPPYHEVIPMEVIDE